MLLWHRWNPALSIFQSELLFSPSKLSTVLGLFRVFAFLFSLIIGSPSNFNVVTKSGMILRNGLCEDRWKDESRLRQQSWDAEWTLVEKVFKERHIELVTSRELAEAHATKKAFMAIFPAYHIREE